MKQIQINKGLIEAVLRCGHLATKMIENTEVPKTELHKVRSIILTHHAERCRRILASEYQSCKCETQAEFVSLPESDQPFVIFDFAIRNQCIDLRADALIIQRIRDNKFSIEPIFFSLGRKIETIDRSLAIVQTNLVEEIVGSRISKCSIFLLGADKPTKINTSVRMVEKKVIELLRSMTGGEQKKTSAVAIPFCKQCPFEAVCFEELKSRDDLSLLGGMSKTEIKASQSRGIFTINQLSYSYRPRRRPESAKPKFYAGLRALAIRENKVFIDRKPSVPTDKVDIFVDVEGLPDIDFYYLIGVHIRTSHGTKVFSFWANEHDDEKENWLAFLGLLRKIKTYRLFHYGSYEKTFFDKMRKRYRLNEEDTQVFDTMRGRLVNVVSLIYGQVYFPTFTNGLKDIGAYLGTKWSNHASGLLSVAWRDAWEISGHTNFRILIERYNSEDCSALSGVVDFIRKVSASKGTPLVNGKQVENAADLRLSSSYRWGNTEFLVPELEAINKCAYFDYQSTKIFLGHNRKKIKKKSSAKTMPKIRTRINKTVKLQAPQKCPQCKSTSTYRHGHYTRMKIDIKFFDGGIKRWIVRSELHRRRCRKCRCTYMPSNYPRFAPRFGWNLKAFVIYMNVVLRLNFGEIREFLFRVLSLPMSHTSLWKMKQELAEYYQPTVKLIFRTMKKGPLLQVDETNAKVEQKGCYVWVFATLFEVVYLFAETRKGDILQKNLRTFKGVLVSDFFAAYDSVPCKQQKCLVHLIRDLNDDLFKNQLNEEFKGVVVDFARLMKSIVGTIDRWGLRARYLQKHKKEVNRFFKKIAESQFETEISQQYQKRFLKNQERLFVFLDHDNVPWNNNYAENAIKTFAEFRHKFSRRRFNQDGLREHLILLSIQHTCKLRGIDFLQFLLSGKKSLPPGNSLISNV